MSTVDIHTPAGATDGTVELPAEIFDVQANIALMHQVVTAQLAAARQGTHAAKTRGQVAGGGAKPYRQKGTGRARQGSIRAPQFTGGGVVHPPTPRDYEQRTPKKMKAAALRGALSDRARGGRVHVISGLLDGDAPSTKDAVAALAGVVSSRHVLVVLEHADQIGWRSLRNVPAIHLLDPGQLNTYDVLVSDDVVFTRSALETFLSTRTAAKGSASTVTTDTTAADAPFGAGSHPPLADGGQPEGFDIKGNASSKLYHVPGSSHYDRTDAEVWFATAEDAESAGFALPPSQHAAAAEEGEQK